MPSSEEILKQFRDDQAQVKSRDPVQNEVMARKLEALINEPHPEKSAQMAYDLLRDHSDSAMGVAVCQCLLNKPDGVKLATNVGRAVTTAELGNVTNTNGVESFLRGNSSSSTFSKEFISQTSPNYVNSIKQKAEQLAQRHDVSNLAGKTEPERLQSMIDLTKDIKSLACNTDDLSPESKQYLSALNAGVQDDEGFAERFSESADMSLEQAQETQQRLGEIAINNSAALRFVMSEVVTNPELNRNPYWKNCAQVAQKSFNLNQKDNLGQGSDGNYKLITGNEPPMYDPRYDEIAKEKKLLREQINKAKEEGLDTADLEEQVNVLELESQEIVRVGDIAKKEEIQLKTKPFLEGVHTEGTRQEVTNMMTNLKETDPPEDLGMDFEGEHQNTSVERGLDDEELTNTVKTEIAEQQMAQATKPFEDHIKQLEDRKQQLKDSPTLKDKAQAFFKHGFKGVKGEMAKIDKEIAVTQTAIQDVKQGVSLDDRREYVERMKQGMQANQSKINQGKAELLNSQLKESNPGLGGKSMSDKKVDKLEDKMAAQKEMMAKLKTEEKVLSVREKLSMNQGSPKVEAPKVHHSVK